MQEDPNRAANVIHARFGQKASLPSTSPIPLWEVELALDVLEFAQEHGIDLGLIEALRIIDTLKGEDQ